MNIAIDIFNLPGVVLYHSSAVDPSVRVGMLNGLAKNLEKREARDLQKLAERDGQVSFGECLSLMTECLTAIITKSDEQQDVRLAALRALKPIVRISYDAYIIVLDELNKVQSAMLKDRNIRREVLRFRFFLSGKELPKRIAIIPVRVVGEVNRMQFAYVC